MPKRSRERDSDMFEYFRKKIKKLEKKIKASRRKRTRVVESESSESSRETSPAPHNQQGGHKEQTRAMSPTAADAPPSTSSDAPHEPHAPQSAPEPHSLPPPAPPELPAPAAAQLEPAAQSVPATLDDNEQKAEGAGASLPDEQQSTSGPVNIDNETCPPDETLDSVLLEILGEDPSTTVDYGPEIHKDLASRLEHFAITGMDAKNRKELTTKYLLPENCTRIAAPILNAEIKAALSEAMVKRDKIIETKQSQLATAIASLASAMTDQLNSKNIDHELLKKLMDTARLLCDIQCTESKTRRNFAMYSVKKEMKDHLSSAKIDKYLFGENLSEALKTAKAVNKSSTDLKVPLPPKINKKPVQQTQKTQGGKHLNWKPPVPARRPPGPQRSREPAYHRAAPASSSKKSSPLPKQTRRR